MKTVLNLFAIAFFALVMAACSEYEGDLPEQPDPPADPMNQSSSSF